MAEHTPGRWRQVEDRAGTSPNVMTEDGSLAIAHCGGVFQPRAPYPHWQIGKANARLIAAAPRLLEALEAAEELWAMCPLDSGDDIREIAERVAETQRAAIDAARGESD